MYERLLKQTERYLEGRKEVVVPIKQVWEAMMKQGKTENFTVPSLMADFECLLEGDHRFEFISESASKVHGQPDFEEFLEHDELEKLGFVNDQKVKLRRASFRPRESDEESFDALDAAISLEELDENLGDTSLLDSDSITSNRSRGESAPPTSDAGRTKRPAAKAPKVVRTKAPTTPKKNLGKKPSAKKGKK